ncbi:hypothetical protein HPB49_020916 [Dermacentor silvarum]|uniref:Uncharacterized protein n=1 Tax=Dermacentor silvarum TaxID=543639 RepID=A0ACB8C5A9_DERSI|nr:hypothetical protein HPB49_020916 [Dermacentor silvarum]
MELVREFGDPLVLGLAEDHIILKLETAWPRTSLADDDGLLLVANQRSLVCAARSAFPREARISKALFCGCTSFESSRHYASAASELLRDTQEIYIVHNRDKVYKLIRMFPNAKVLALPHDLCTHALELDEPRRDRSAPLVDRSQLRELVGSMRSLSEGCMRLSRETTLAVMLTCPQVGVGSSVMLAKISAFRNLRSLMLALDLCIVFADVHLELKRLLTMLPGLEELAVENCGGLRLSTIARLCPKIKRLKLAGCMGSSEDNPVDADAFPNLECVDMNILLSSFIFNSFLCATREVLRTARFEDDGMCAEFLQYCVQHGRRLPFPRLEHLSLDTEESLRGLELEPRDLHDVLKALPAIRHLQTDSYDLRLFDNYCVPRGRVSLLWTGCVYCQVHRPDTCPTYTHVRV